MQGSSGEQLFCRPRGESPHEETTTQNDPRFSDGLRAKDCAMGSTPGCKQAAQWASHGHAIYLAWRDTIESGRAGRKGGGGGICLLFESVPFVLADVHPYRVRCVFE